MQFLFRTNYQSHVEEQILITIYIIMYFIMIIILITTEISTQLKCCNFAQSNYASGTLEGMFQLLQKIGMWYW